jgi:hypothetical protein
MARISIDRFKKLYPERPNKEIAEIFCLSIATVSRIARSLGLKKHPNYISEMAKQRNKNRWVQSLSSNALNASSDLEPHSPSISQTSSKSPVITNTR